MLVVYGASRPSKILQVDGTQKNQQCYLLHHPQDEDHLSGAQEGWFVRELTLKLPGEGQLALPLNLNDKNIPNADFFLVF